MNNPKKNRRHLFMNSFKDEMTRLFIVSFGVFLFVLFFQPFPLGMLDYDDRLLYVTGFGVINFLSAWLILIILPAFSPKWFKISDLVNDTPILTSLLLLLFTVIAFAFYIVYIGKIPLTKYIMFKVFLVSLLPLMILRMLYKNKSMESVISILQEQNNYNILKLNEYEKTAEEDEFEIISDNKSDKLTLKYRNIVFVKSADNYIEIYYLENNSLEKKLLRNTLKKIEVQLAAYRSFIRCHRTSIVNSLYIDKLARDFSGYYLKISYFEEKLPVSRQFLPQVRKAISVIK